ncbi:MAG: hypothetical protein MJ127_04915 [Mogibacterium sp.]|nr:hypothetical protein [Mogibacterium sp.]
MKNLPILIVLLPLVAAQLCLVFSRIHRNVGRWLVITAVSASLVMSVMQLLNVIKDGPIHYYFGNYRAPIGIEFSIDTVNGIMLILVCVIGLLTFLFSSEFRVSSDKTIVGGMNTVLCLLITGLLGMTSTGDVFNLYVFLEITSLSAYCLIAMGGNKGVIAAYRYMLVGTVAATLYLLGVAVLYANTGTLNMADMAVLLNEGDKNKAMLLAMILFIAAFGIKMALFPFHGWQPAAYTHAETSARPLISGVMGKIPAYAMFRYLFCVYGTDFKYFDFILDVLGVLSVCAMLYGSIRAMGQKDMRKLLAYSSVAQIGYISLGFAIGTPLALAGAFLHMFGHAFMKAGLFFCVGAIVYRYGKFSLEDVGRLYKKMPITCGLLVLAALSMVGIPPAVGFFSKWYLGLAAAREAKWIYLAVLVISSLLNAVYFFRLIEKFFINPDKGLPQKRERGRIEASAWILIPVIVCFVAILALGLCNAKIVDVLLLTLGEVGL